MSKKSLILSANIENLIMRIRGNNIMLDKDLATLYGVTTGNLNKAVSRNKERFPRDFMFRLNKEEFDNLKFQFGTSSWGGSRTPPRAFTEQGVAMLSSVLRSNRAVKVNIQIVRTFVMLRDMLATHAQLSRKLNALEKKYDVKFKVVFDVIRKLMASPVKKNRQIGFQK